MCLCSGGGAAPQAGVKGGRDLCQGQWAKQQVVESQGVVSETGEGEGGQSLCQGQTRSQVGGVAVIV